jgi:hypothetical protein
MLGILAVLPQQMAYNLAPGLVGPWFTGAVFNLQPVGWTEAWGAVITLPGCGEIEAGMGTGSLQPYPSGVSHANGRIKSSKARGPRITDPPLVLRLCLPCFNHPFVQFAMRRIGTSVCAASALLCLQPLAAAFSLPSRHGGWPPSLVPRQDNPAGAAPVSTVCGEIFDDIAASK